VNDAPVTVTFLPPFGGRQRQPREWIDRFKAIGLGAQQEQIG
jgi:hypothetical protein